MRSLKEIEVNSYYGAKFSLSFMGNYKNIIEYSVQNLSNPFRVLFCCFGRYQNPVIICSGVFVSSSIININTARFFEINSGTRDYLSNPKHGARCVRLTIIPKINQVTQVA